MKEFQFKHYATAYVGLIIVPLAVILSQGGMFNDQEEHLVQWYFFEDAPEPVETLGVHTHKESRYENSSLWNVTHVDDADFDDDEKQGMEFYMRSMGDVRLLFYSV